MGKRDLEGYEVTDSAIRVGCGAHAGDAIYDTERPEPLRIPGMK